MNDLGKHLNAMRRRAFLQFGIFSTLVLLIAGRGRATDYFLTIAGGYSPAGNQASLEANVIFFQEILLEKHVGPRVATTFFADGFNDRPDLQVLRPRAESKTPATDLLHGLHTFRGTNAEVEYRNHRVPNIAGPIDPESIRSSLKRQTRNMAKGDRLFVYVTAHGGSAKGKDKYNTTISCWNNKSISSRDFATWLDDVPKDVPVVMVMAQCYCGGFSHVIFQGADSERGLAEGLRVGFFAQQHDLAAAGCRPDIENDEEYSSFFWGSLVGRSRTGNRMTDADHDRDGRVAFAEAHAHALLVSETIDIPLRSTEALLRVYSRIGGGYEHRRDVRVAEEDVDEVDEPSRVEGLAEMTGSYRRLASLARPDQSKVIEGLVERLGMSMDDDVTSVFVKFEAYRVESRTARRSTFRGRSGRRSSGRRDLLAEIGDAWPELADRETWRDSALLAEDHQQKLFEELTQLAGYERYMTSRKERAAASDKAEETELIEVKYQRLINTLEAVLLAQNLPRLVSSEVVERYAEMLALEESTL